ncbi:MAG: substrate-binding domain-containing protein [Clostridiales Family XIII bacterium]|jgi:ABC-type sugar transport system substrate-binding protein|nr:substrate-binding domain-containing protein [Clostridiales Family XIII bacterium]
MVKNMKRRKLLALLLAIAMVFVFTACTSDGNAPAEEPPAQQEEGTAADDTAATESDEEIVIGYFALTMVSQWLQNVNKALTDLGKEKGFKVVNADADFDGEKQMSQLDTQINAGLDGAVVFIADEGMGTAVAEKCQQAGVPLIGESLRVADADNNLLAPVVELDAHAVGSNGAEWLIENIKEEGFNPDDFSKTGYIALTNSNQVSTTIRIEGFEDTFFGEYKDFPDANKFVSDVAAEATSSDDTDATFKLVSAILGAHPDIENWIMFSGYDDLAIGACRADEQAKLQDKTCLIDCGGERGIPEWEAGNAPEWRACVYYNAMEFAEPIVDAMLAMIKDGKSAEDVFADQKEDGQKFASYKISGTVVTPETYKDIYLPGY